MQIKGLDYSKLMFKIEVDETIHLVINTIIIIIIILMNIVIVNIIIIGLAHELANELRARPTMPKVRMAINSCVCTRVCVCLCVTVVLV